MYFLLRDRRERDLRPVRSAGRQADALGERCEVNANGRAFEALGGRDGRAILAHTDPVDVGVDSFCG